MIMTRKGVTSHSKFMLKSTLLSSYVILLFFFLLQHYTEMTKKIINDRQQDLVTCLNNKIIHAIIFANNTILRPDN